MPELAKIDAWHLAVPIEHPVRTSFGAMHERQAVWLKLTSKDGAEGWGEAWCNFPATAASYRLDILERVIGPWMLSTPFDHPTSFIEKAHGKFRILAIQSGESGPLANVIAALDCAAWDLQARMAGKPLAAFLGATYLGPLPAYASGLNPKLAHAQMETARHQGYRAFKLKIGFANDNANIRLLCDALRQGESLMVDANQAFDLVTAEMRLKQFEEMPLTWVEEPIAADLPPAEIERLAATSRLPLAGGENITDHKIWAELISSKAYRYLQPDCAKWGGVSRTIEIARLAVENGLAYCPHFLGGGIGLATSAHMLAAIGGDGLLEIDSNPNPLRDEIVPPLTHAGAGMIELPDGPGIGVEPDLKAAKRWIVRHIEIEAGNG